MLGRKKQIQNRLLKAEFAFSIKTDLADNQIGFDFQPQRKMLAQTKSRKTKFISEVHPVFVIGTVLKKTNC